MASAVLSAEEFGCPVCLETLRDPATLPCGHTYCLPCIQKHWDKGEAKQVFSCPQCRQTFTPRPVLARSTLLVEAMEKLRVRGGHEDTPRSISSAPPSMPVCSPNGSMDARPCEGGIYPQLPVSSWVCPEHQRPLELFCRDDQESVCAACRDVGHKGHQVVTPEAERTERQRQLVEMQANTQRRIQERERELQLLSIAARAHKVSLQALQRDAGEVFAELLRGVELTGSQVQELLGAHEAAEGSRAEGQIHRLEQEQAQLRRMDEELRRLAQMQDPVCFLKNFLALDAPLLDGGGRMVGSNTEVAMFEGVRAVLEELKDQHQGLCKAYLARIFRIVNDSSAQAQMPMTSDTEVEPRQGGGGAEQRAESASQRPVVNEAAVNVLQNPEPKTRDELLKFRFEPTLDPNTAYRHLRLSEENRKATLRAETQTYPEHPDRFLFWRQRPKTFSSI
ncbi:hypothetical protein MATL_G00117730 [Megalops atlanticus]|uniref:Uncharacterized protein n=1 Tax=Megalops atlanticus TaxID=7932 RepID=A0A9D3TB86_MEGAT|nr:hypothetical protein MATL_G00117730 [Megalops atlanticus]